MPVKSARRRREATRSRVRRHRIYQAAVAAGVPKALDAESWRDPMSRYNARKAEVKAMPSSEHSKYEAEVRRLYQEGLDARYEKRYIKLRAEVIAAAEEIFT